MNPKHEIRSLLVFTCILLDAATAVALSHTWDVNELFSNADGTIQFIELVETDGNANEVALPLRTMSTNTSSFVIGGPPLVAPTSYRSYLIATAAFAALPGAPTPDALIPAGNLPFFFAPAGDTVNYEPWDSLTYGAGKMPVNGIHSLNRSLSVSVNSPTNYSGESGTIDASAPIPTPATPASGLLLLGALLLLAAFLVGFRSRFAGAP